MWTPFGGSKPDSTASTSKVPDESRTESVAQDSCPVDESTRRAWLAQSSSKGTASAASSSSSSSNASSALAFLQAKPEEHQTVTSDGSKLSKDRVISSIPRWSKETPEQASEKAAAAAAPSSSNWVYPSPSQFFSAMSRKNHNPRAEDMNVVVPIHNAVNERAWNEILEWERIADEQSWKTCGGPKLVSFKGRPKDVTWKAWSRSLLGYQLPFDRHDWEVDRCGKRVRYVIDFYTGRSDGRGPSGLSFYLDVRPSPAEWEGWRMKLMRIWSKTFA